MTQFNREEKLNRLTISNITGGGQYCYLRQLGPIGLAVFNSGKLPLDRCDVRINDNSPIKPGQSLQDYTRQRLSPVLVKSLGPISPDRNNRGVTIGVSLAPGSYFVSINTRNDAFFETLDIGPDHDKAEIRDFDGKLIHVY
jgi:hypothetical protein